MSKLFNEYSDDLDRAWFESTNIIYAECDDKENQLKKVRITFKNGATYEYKDVNVTDYLFFREAPSTGKAFIKYIKKYECEKLDSLDPNLLMEEYQEKIKNKITENTEENEQN